MNLDEPGALRPDDQEPATLDRTILGIPNEDDEYTRGLTFFIDPSTGQPSAPSTSEESEDPVPVSPYEPSVSSDNTGSRIVYTPQSDSDVPVDLHSQVVSPKSARSSDSGSCQGKADRSPLPSVSACAAAGTVTAPASPTSAMEGDFQLAAASSTPTNLSVTVNLLAPNDLGPLDRDDIEFLENEMNRSLEEQASQRRGMRMTRTQRSGRTRHDPIGPRGTTRTGTDRAQLIEKTKMMRRLGVCLPCLVNHEPVSR